MNLNAHLGTMTDNVICFTETKKKIEARRLAAVEEELQQQAWFLETEARLNKKRDCIILLFIFDLFLGVIALFI